MAKSKLVQTRAEIFQQLFPQEPPFRLHQIEKALFEEKNRGWETVTTLPKNFRSRLAKKLPWISLKEKLILQSKNSDTFKAAVESLDGLLLETVLMANRHGQWTICVSSQVGCSMRCSFCATGAMGLKRSLTSDEIIDQYRFWRYFLAKRPSLSQAISNIVFMGMGEPLANYEAVKTAIQTLLNYTNLGPTKITVSSVGILPQLEKILQDPDWPPVRLAISLHSANAVKRREIVPTSVPDFLPRLKKWTQDYARLLGNRRHWITFEYTLINGVNDTDQHARELAAYITKTAARKINVIPYNPIKGKTFSRSQPPRIDRFKAILRSRGIDVTQRKTMGDDIAAACGQLAISQE